MKIPRIYIDTSVIGGCFDKEFAPWSKGLIKDIRLGHFKCVVSEIVSAEIEDAPLQVRQKYDEIRGLGAEELFLSEDVEGLLNGYRKHHILADKIRQFNAVNLEQGYQPIAIHSPREVANYVE